MKSFITFIIEELSNKDKPIPPKVMDKFKELGDLQRDKPERAMSKVGFANGGGVMNPAVEHIGDITHRMTHHIKWGDRGHDPTDYNTVKDKIDKTNRWMNSRYGFEKEHEENLKSNAEYYNKPLEQHRTDVNNALQNYADEHKKLPVYNRAQYHAREAAVSLGERRFDDTRKHLGMLSRMSRTPETWKTHALHHKLDDNGEPKQFDPNDQDNQ